MPNNSLTVFATFVVACMLFIGCEPITIPATQNSSLLAIGDQNNGELRILESCPDGGFILGTHTTVNGQQDFLVMKFNSVLELQWKRIIGGIGYDQLDKIYIDENENILLAGVSIGFGEDDWPILERSTAAVAYCHLLNASGQTLWEYDYPLHAIWGSPWHIDDIIKDENGDFVLAGYLGLEGFGSTILKVNADGVFQIYFVMNNQSLHALYKSETSYTAFRTNAFGDKKAEIIQVRKIGVNGKGTYYGSVSTEWPWGSSSAQNKGSVAQIKLVPNQGQFNYTYFFRDEIYQYSYDINARTLTGSSIDSEFKKVISVNLTRDKHFIFTEEDGKVTETDSDFKKVNSFQTDLNVFSSTFSRNFVTKLLGGNYVIGFQKDNDIFLAHFNQEGQIIGNE